MFDVVRHQFIPYQDISPLHRWPLHRRSLHHWSLHPVNYQYLVHKPPEQGCITSVVAAPGIFSCSDHAMFFMQYR